jgi:hypothetical protein
MLILLTLFRKPYASFLVLLLNIYPLTFSTLLLLFFLNFDIEAVPHDRANKKQSPFSEAGISVNLGHPQGRFLKWTLNFLGKIPCLSLIGIDL